MTPYILIATMTFLNAQNQVTDVRVVRTEFVSQEACIAAMKGAAGKYKPGDVGMLAALGEHVVDSFECKKAE